ncbi:MAG: hypothetical protein KF851_00925 [Pirellulaceae bacterium]|nr:hypothetical protein [Pirellulaceae bacterium]
MSTHIENISAPIQIPQTISEKLNHVAARHQSNERVFRWGGWLALAVSSLLMMVIIDLAWELDTATQRFSGWLIAIGSLLTLGCCWERFIERPLTWLEAAWRVESVRPEIEERLSSTIEFLTDQPHLTGSNSNCENSNIPTASYSPQLLAALSQEASRATANVDSQDVPVRASWPIVTTVATAITLFLLITIINPIGVCYSLRNWMMPWATPIFPALQIDLLPGDTTVVEGESLDVTATALTRETEGTLESMSVDGQMSCPFNRATERQATLPALNSDTTYRLRVGKRITRDYQVRVLPKPIIEQVTIRVDFPAYAQLPFELYDDPTESVLALVGSRITIEVVGDQHAQRAELRWDNVGDPLLTSSDFRFDIPCPDAQQRLGEIRLISSEGVPSEPYAIRVEIHGDQPPRVQIHDPALSRFYLPRERPLSVQFAVQDDIAIEKVELLYRAADSPADIPPQTIEALLERTSDQETVGYQGEVSVNLDSLSPQTSGAVVWLRATDNRGEAWGGPQVVESETMLVEFRPIESTPLEQRLEAERQAIQEALDAARQELANAKTAIEQLADEKLDAEENEQTGGEQNETERPIDPQQQLAASKQALEQLAETMEQANSDYAEQANKTREISEDHLEAAEQQLDRLPLIDEPAKQAESIEQARQVLEHANEKLVQLEQELQEKAKALETAAKLEDLARQQQMLADELDDSQKQAQESKISDTELAANEQANNDQAWQQRQQQLADELAAMQPEEQQAERAEQLAEQARELAERWEQLEQSQNAKQGKQDDENAQQQLAQQQQELMQQAEELKQDIEQLAAEGMPHEKSQQQLDEAQARLDQAAEQMAEQAAERNSEKNSERNGEQNAVDQNQQVEDAQQQRQQDLGQQDQQGEQDQQRQSSPANELRKTAEALQQVCQTCRDCAQCQNPGDSKTNDSANKMNEACQECNAAAKAPSREQAQQHAKNAAEKLAELAEKAAKKSGLRKNCEKCKDCDKCPNPGDNPANPGSKPGNKPDGTKSVTEQPFERLPLRGGTSSGWTRAKRQLKNGVLDGREALIPEPFRDVVTDYFEALAKQADETEAEKDSRQAPKSDSEQK